MIANSFTLSDLGAVLSAKKQIMTVPHWNAIPVLTAEMKTLSRRERAIKRNLKAQGIAFAPSPKPEHWTAYETGDRVQHTEYGTGNVIGLNYSGKLKVVIYTVRYDDGATHTSLAGDLTPEEAGRDGGTHPGRQASPQPH